MKKTNKDIKIDGLFELTDETYKTILSEIEKGLEYNTVYNWLILSSAINYKRNSIVMAYQALQIVNRYKKTTNNIELLLNNTNKLSESFYNVITLETFKGARIIVPNMHYNKDHTAVVIGGSSTKYKDLNYIDEERFIKADRNFPYYILSRQINEIESIENVKEFVRCSIKMIERQIRIKNGLNRNDTTFSIDIAKEILKGGLPQLTDTMDIIIKGIDAENTYKRMVKMVLKLQLINGEIADISKSALNTIRLGILSYALLAYKYGNFKLLSDKLQKWHNLGLDTSIKDIVTHKLFNGILLSGKESAIQEGIKNILEDIDNEKYLCENTRYTYLKYTNLTIAVMQSKTQLELARLNYIKKLEVEEYENKTGRSFDDYYNSPDYIEATSGSTLLEA